MHVIVLPGTKTPILSKVSGPLPADHPNSSDAYCSTVRGCRGRFAILDAPSVSDEVLSHSATHCARRAATLDWPPKASIGRKLRETGGGHRHGECQSLQPLLCANCAPPTSVLWRSTLAAEQRTRSEVVDRPPSRGRPVHSLSQVV
jgi:hypothetical protein